MLFSTIGHYGEHFGEEETSHLNPQCATMLISKIPFLDHQYVPVFEDAIPHVATYKAPHGRIYRWGMMIGFCASLFSIAFAVLQKMMSRSMDNRLVAAGLMGLMVHGNFLLIGLFSVCIYRYVIPMLPLLAICCLLSFDWAREKIIASMGLRTKKSAIRDPG